MRKQLILCGLVLAALALGAVTAGAALQNAVNAKIKFKKAGAHGSIELQLINMNDVPLPEGRPLSAQGVRNALRDGGLVPERIRRIIVSSSSIRYNHRALPYCRVIFNGQNKIPTRADGITGTENLTYVPKRSNSSAVKRACPQKSILGTGTFTATIGVPGAAYDPSQAGALDGSLTAYNYKPRKGDTLGVVVRISVTNPVPSNQYIYVGVSRSGIIPVDIPSRAELPINLDAALLPGEISITSMAAKLKSPKPPRARRGRKAKQPIFTVKSFKDVKVYGQLVRQ